MAGQEGVITNPDPISTTILQKINEGLGIEITGTNTNPIIGVEQSIITGLNNVVTSIDAGTNISLTGTTKQPTINVTGVVTSVNAGTNTSITGTAKDPIVNVTGVVTSVSAGTNVTITGTASAPIVNATAPPVPAFSGFRYSKTHEAPMFSGSGRIGNWTLAVKSAYASGDTPATSWPAGYSTDGYDTTGGSFNTTTGVWTVPTTGYWSVILREVVRPIFGMQYLIVFRNTTTNQFLPLIFNEYVFLNPQDMETGSGIVYLTSGDLCEIYLYASGAGNVNTYAAEFWTLSTEFISSS
jgi:hypothetical protein